MRTLSPERLELIDAMVAEANIGDITAGLLEKDEHLTATLRAKSQAAARTRREVLPRLLRVTSPPMWSITTGGRSGNLATNSSFPPMLST